MKISIKDSELFSRQLKNVVKLFGTSKSYAILAANFGVNPHNTVNVIESIRKESISWTTELRVDNKWEYYIEPLLNSNLEIVSVGLESASPTILSHMNKTRNIQRYLEKTQKLIDKFAYSQSDLRLNLMLYAGETPETINETVLFLGKNMKQISSVICSPIMMIENTPLWNDFNSYVENFGTSLYESEYWKKRRVYPLNLSSYFNFNDAANLCTLLEKIYSNPDSWVKERKYLFKQEAGKEEYIAQGLKRNIFG